MTIWIVFKKFKPHNLTSSCVLFAFLLATCGKAHIFKYEKYLKVEFNYETQVDGHGFLLLDKLKVDEEFSLKRKFLLSEKGNSKIFNIKPIDNTLPNYIQFRFSERIDTLKINFIKLNFKYNELFITGKDLNKYFILQKGVGFDSENQNLFFEKHNNPFPKMIRLNPNFISYLERKY